MSTTSANSPTSSCEILASDLQSEIQVVIDEELQKLAQTDGKASVLRIQVT